MTPQTLPTFLDCVARDHSMENYADSFRFAIYQNKSIHAIIEANSSGPVKYIYVSKLDHHSFR